MEVFLHFIKHLPALATNVSITIPLVLVVSIQFQYSLNLQISRRLLTAEGGSVIAEPFHREPVLISFFPVVFTVFLYYNLSVC
jgi:hypothetical protein